MFAAAVDEKSPILRLESNRPERPKKPLKSNPLEESASKASDKRLIKTEEGRKGGRLTPLEHNQKQAARLLTYHCTTSFF